MGQGETGCDVPVGTGRSSRSKLLTSPKLSGGSELVNPAATPSTARARASIWCQNGYDSVVLVPSGRKRRGRAHHAARIKPGIDPLQAKEAVGQQAGAPGRSATRHFGDDERAPDRVRAAARAAAGRRRQEAGGQRTTRKNGGKGCQADEDAAHQRHRTGEGDTPAVECHFGEPRQVGRYNTDQIERELREREPDGSRQERERDTLGEDEPRDALASRAKCDAHGEFMLPGRCAHQHQRGDVGDGEQQHQRHGTSEEPELATRVADDGVPERLRIQARRAVLKPGGPEGKDAHTDSVEVADGLLEASRPP